MHRIVAMLVLAGVAALGLGGGDAFAAKRSAADQALYERAVKACNGWKYRPNGARPVINYKARWYRCEPRREYRVNHRGRNGHR